MAQVFDSNLDKVAFAYIRKLNVQVTKTSLCKTLKENAFYPSLYSLSSTFDRFNILNESFRIDKEKLLEIPPPFIALVRDKSKGDDFVIVYSMSDDSVTYSADGKKMTLSNSQDFTDKFLNVVFTAEANNNSGESDYKKKRDTEVNKRRNDSIFLTGIALVLLLGVFYFNYTYSNFTSSITISLVIVAGLVVTILLLLYEIDKTNSIVKSICSGSNTKTDCDAVLSSSASKIFGITWSEAGFFYFATLTLFTFFSSIAAAEKVPYIALAFTATAIYIPFSIYYQYKVVKQWCRLCLATQCVLAGGLLWSILNFWLNDLSHVQFNVYILATLLVSVILPATSWFLLKPFFIKAKDADQFDAAHKRLLYNPDIFNSLLQLQPKAADGWQSLGLSIGNPLAETTILKVCNPYCGPCAKAHPVLEKIIDSNSNVNLKVIFTPTSEGDDVINKPIRHLMAIASRQNLSYTKHALDEWYNAPKKDYESFAKKFPLKEEELKAQSEKIDTMRKWCDASSIAYTPTIFVNGWRLPEMYSIEELKSIL